MPPPDTTHPELSRLLAGLTGGPADGALWLIIADWLEEQGQTERAELTRLTRRAPEMPRRKARWAAEDRIRELIAGGVRPCVMEITNGVGMRLALIPAGPFWMGSQPDEEGDEEDEDTSDEEPRHRVRITQPFWMGVFPVTQAEYEAVTGRNPSHFSKTGRGKSKVKKLDTSTFPVEMVDWGDAVAFCTALSARPEEKAAGRSYRLPSEAEWEYACRAGLASGRFHFGGEKLRKDQANWRDAKLGRTCPVGMYLPNAWGLYDMHGNVDEWCHDWYDPTYYDGSPAADPPGPDDGEERVTRGGTWRSFEAGCTTACRYGVGPDESDDAIGLRVVMTTSAPPRPKKKPGRGAAR